MDRIRAIEHNKQTRRAQQRLDARLADAVLQVVVGNPRQEAPLAGMLGAGQEAPASGLTIVARNEARTTLQDLLDQGANPNAFARDPHGVGMVRVVNLLLGRGGDLDLALFLVEQGAELDDQSVWRVARMATRGVLETSIGSWTVVDQEKQHQETLLRLARMAVATPHLDWTQLVPDECHKFRFFTDKIKFQPIQASAAMARYYPEFAGLLESHYHARGEIVPALMPAIGLEADQATKELMGFLRQDTQDEALDRDETRRRVGLWLAAGADPNKAFHTGPRGQQTILEQGMLTLDPVVVGLCLQHGGRFDGGMLPRLAGHVIGHAQVLKTSAARERLLEDMLQVFAMLDAQGQVDLDQMMGTGAQDGGHTIFDGPIQDRLDDALPGFAVRIRARREGGALDDIIPASSTRGRKRRL